MFGKLGWQFFAKCIADTTLKNCWQDDKRPAGLSNNQLFTLTFGRVFPSQNGKCLHNSRRAQIFSVVGFDSQVV